MISSFSVYFLLFYLHFSGLVIKKWFLFCRFPYNIRSNYLWMTMPSFLEGFGLIFLLVWSWSSWAFILFVTSAIVVTISFADLHWICQERLSFKKRRMEKLFVGFYLDFVWWSYFFWGFLFWKFKLLGFGLVSFFSLSLHLLWWFLWKSCNFS